MRLGYTVMYVPDVVATVEFYERVFGLKRRFIDGAQYAEMETGSTALGFASEALAEKNGVIFRRNMPHEAAAGVEICFVTNTPEDAYARAVAEGATPIKGVELKPWGQKVSYLRDLNGCLVEVSSPVSEVQ